MTRNLTCICCPIGCNIKVEFDEYGISDISGNSCARGKEYANNECTNPVRTVTSTVMTKNGIPLSVKTDRPIPKEYMFECMKIINKIVVDAPINTGDIIAENVFGSNIVATQSMV